MENLEKPKFGVLDYKIVDHHYQVDIRWKDGKESQHNFPENGFFVFRPGTETPSFELSGYAALQILINHAAELNEDELNWLDYESEKTVKDPSKKGKKKKSH